MPRIVVNPGSPGAWEIQLKPGTNTLGRGPANDFKIAEPSVSSSHCQILLDNGNAIIKDLGSTNGTYINRAPVKEAVLQTGQTIHLGGVEMLFYSDAPKYAIAAERVPSPPPIPPPALPAARSFAAQTGSQTCKFHPKTMGRFFCSHCQQFFCDICVNSRPMGAVQKKFCRQCGAECEPVQVSIARPAQTQSFFARLPGAFLFPFRGSGVLVLIVGTLIFAALNWLSPGTRYGFIPRAFGWGLIAQVFAVGYLFSFMQAIIHSTAVGEEEMPPLPAMSNVWEDILIPCLQLLGLTLICFGPAIAVAWWAISSEEPSGSMPLALISTFILGCLYFPMAFLAVAMLDTVFAANPLQVVPSIFKVPLEYLVAVILLAVVMGLRPLGDEVLPLIFPRGLATHSMSKLFAFLSAQAFWSLASLYLLTVGMRILGLLFLTKKEKLGWLEH